MERIASFTVDHTKLTPGIYTSRVDGEITTYDIRMRRPNVEPVLSNGALHTIEHLFATYVRNTQWKDQIVYFGPMGCRTGCYFLTRGLKEETVIALVQQAFRFVAEFQGTIPGAAPEECGNYREHDLQQARMDAQRYLTVISRWTPDQLKYQAYL